MAPLHFNMKITGCVSGNPCSPPPLYHPLYNLILICEPLHQFIMSSACNTIPPESITSVVFAEMDAEDRDRSSALHGTGWGGGCIPYCGGSGGMSER